ncbi:MAG: type II toxin-antitoxin system RelE/ParE family toxin [Clostridia bacterium]|nr:type II toxin-antitoxin system RelE/ParE family toxin [Clostridia bacterium]
MPTYQAIFYQKDDGSEPAKEFILSVDKKMRAKILKTIAMLQNNGTELRMPYSEYLEDGIFEIRAKVGTDISRVLYFFVVGHKIILTNGFIKKTQKTPKGEIEKAKQYRKDYLSRKEQDEDDKL